MLAQHEDVVPILLKACNDSRIEEEVTLAILENNADFIEVLKLLSPSSWPIYFNNGMLLL